MNILSSETTIIASPLCKTWRRAWQSMAIQYSCLENPIDRGAWQATVHVVTKSVTQLK